MIVCKNEMIPTTTIPPTPAPVTTFTLIKRKMKWIEAARYCWETMGQRLAIIRDMSELRKVQDLVSTDTWLAGNDYGFQGYWVWASGSPDGIWTDFINAGGPVGMDFNWQKGSGSNHDRDDEQCMFMHGNGEFDDQDCSKDRYFFCDDGKN